jgi:hypothetical protein
MWMLAAMVGVTSLNTHRNLLPHATQQVRNEDVAFGAQALCDLVPTCLEAAGIHSGARSRSRVYMRARNELQVSLYSDRARILYMPPL